VQRAFNLRVERAFALRRREPAEPDTNGDEARYPDKLASYSKGLPHDRLGRVDLKAFKALTTALESGRQEDFEAIPTAGGLRQVNPQSALGYGLEGAESTQLSLEPPPAFASAEQAAEASELYWQALARDVPFALYERDPLIHRAGEELSKLAGFRGPKQAEAVTPATIFRGSAPGDEVGPYVSQFLWKEVPYGAVRIFQQVSTARPQLDYVVRYDDWLAVQNGAPNPPRYGSAYLYMHTARDLGAFVQFDFTYQAFLSACLILFGFEGTYNAQTVYKGAPFDAGNPYRRSRTQSGFVTFGVAHVLDLVARVVSSALRACWYQKWVLHRRLRPEEFGGRVHHHRTQAARYPLHPDILNSAALDLVFARHGTYLLPQGYPEGCPLHPSFPAGHAAIAGACTTVLKAFFDESFPIDDPVVASEDGQRLLKYEGRELTVGGELNKLASNVAMGRNVAGIHWRSDMAAGLKLGEAAALSVLADLEACHHESFDGLSLKKFDGTLARI
jgi:membrane-associated phospholipid phosphatase